MESHRGRPLETGRPFTSAGFDDPSKRIGISWDTLSTQAILTHYSPLPQEVEEKVKAWATFKTNCVSGPGTTVEKLGTRKILGIEAEGVRATREIPAGWEGNDQAVTVTEERWYSTELQMQLLDVYNDPLVGTSRWEITDLQRMEPSPELFEVPAGYTIKDDVTK